MQISINVPTLIVEIVNFLILLSVLKVVLFGPLTRTIEEREAKIKGQLDEAEALNAAATSLKAEYEQKLRDARQEAEQIISSATKEAERIKFELVADGNREKQRLIDKGHNEVAREQQEAMAQIRSRVVGLSVDMATQLFKEALSPEQHRALVESFTVKAEQIHAG
jgi:F-type H+-transporting ATPase subunit b